MNRREFGTVGASNTTLALLLAPGAKAETVTATPHSSSLPGLPAFPSPDVTRKLFPGFTSGHLLPEERPEEVLAELQKFFAQ